MTVVPYDHLVLNRIWHHFNRAEGQTVGLRVRTVRPRMGTPRQGQQAPRLPQVASPRTGTDPGSQGRSSLGLFDRLFRRGDTPALSPDPRERGAMPENRAAGAQGRLFEPNLLYYGDNLLVLREHVRDETIDLVYLDPPFKSGQNYNLLFREVGGERPTSQVKAFRDTWRWDEAAWESYQETVRTGPPEVSEALQAFKRLVGKSDMLAYLSMMAPRLVELRRVLSAPAPCISTAILPRATT